MAVYPSFTKEDAALVAGVPATDYSSFIDEAIKQATLLFKIGTCLSAWPDNEVDADLARYAVLNMADAIHAAQPWQKVLRSPFNSETIGSYSYSKLSTAVSAGLPTGVSWFDLAISKLSVCDQNLGIPAHGGYNVFEEHKEAQGGYGVFLGPGDQYPDTWGTSDDVVKPPERM